MGNYFLSLSLFVMMLCFFIVLNTHSTFEKTKAMDVLESLNMAFSNRFVESGRAAPTQQQSPEDGLGRGSIIEEIHGLFEAQIPAIDVTKNRFGNEMSIRLALADFEAAITDSALSGQNVSQVNLRPALMALIDSQAFIPMRMDVLVETDQNPAMLANDNLQVLQGLRKQAVGIANNLEAAGLPNHLVTTGIKQGRKGSVTLYFRPYQPLDPKIFRNIQQEKQEGALKNGASP